jgi:hypothetical protein
MADYTPWFYRTTDYGKTWTKIVTGLPTDRPNGCFARVIRCDTKRAGLLFAGTETAMHVSFDNGDHWQSLMLNLPNTSYRDMQIHENDLVVGTYGRSFWILDDISPLRQISASQAKESAVLFKPGDAIRVRRNVNDDTPLPPEIPHALNPPAGVCLYYYFAQAPQQPVRIEVSDSTGRIIRRMSSEPIPPLKDFFPPIPNFWIEEPKPLPTAQGMNRTIWNLRFDSPASESKSIAMNANPGETPYSPEGPMVAPGDYTVTLIANGKRISQTVTVKNDPRSPASASSLKAQYSMVVSLYDYAQAAWDGMKEAQAMRATLADLLKSNPEAEITTAANALDTKLLAMAGSGGGGRRGFGGGATNTPPTFGSLNGTMLRLLENLEFGDMAPNEPMKTTFKRAESDMSLLKETWSAFVKNDLGPFNALLAKHNRKQISIPAFSKMPH